MAGCGAFVVDPVTTDEWDPVARFSGLAGMDRVCRFHALNHRSVARRVASEMGRTYEESAFIVAHLGTGITVGAHVGGRVIDSCDAMCEGSFSVDRAGWLPTLSLIDMCYSGEFTRSEMLRRVNGGGGVFSYLGTTDMRAVEEMASSGDERALRVVEAMAYQTAKDIGAMAAVCRGRVDCVVLTGALARYKDLADMIASRVGFIAPVRIVPGEDEMESLASGALRVLEGTERAKTYPGVTAGA
jgi:butyrate kinase